MGQERPRISSAWCTISSLKGRLRCPAERAHSTIWATMHTSSFMSSVHTTATDARYCVPSLVLPHTRISRQISSLLDVLLHTPNSKDVRLALTLHLLRCLPESSPM